MARTRTRTAALMSFRSRTRSILGGSVLGGDNPDGDGNELPAMTMGAISLVLGCDLGSAGVRSRQCWDAISVVLQAARSRLCWGATRPVQSRVGADAGYDKTGASGVISLLFLSLSLSLSLSSIFLGWKSFEGKIKPENELPVR